MRVRELKQQMIDGGIVGFALNQFSLILPADDNHGLSADTILEDESLPLHLFKVGDNTTIKIIGSNIQVQLVTQRGRHWPILFPRRITVNQMKQRIRLVDRFFTDRYKDLLEDVWLFIQQGELYQRLDEESALDAVLSDNDVIHLVENRFFSLDDLRTVYHKGQEVGRVGWIIRTEYDSNKCYYYSDTALSLKLRIQEQLGFPVNYIDINVRGKLMKNDEMLNDYNVDLKTEFRIEVL